MFAIRSRHLAVGLLVLVAAVSSVQQVHATEEEATTAATTEEGTDNTDATKAKLQTPPEDVWNVKDHLEDDWGTYYDPQNIFCGKFDCYKILGFDFESFHGKEKPSRSSLTKRYRAISREWHPDKNRKAGAKEKFVKIARAYEVLTNKDTRKEYDALRYDQDAYLKKHGAGVVWQFAPKSDTTAIVLFLLMIGSVITWYMQQSRWQSIADKLVQAAVQDLGHKDGGTHESKELRQRALIILDERNNNESNGTTDADMPKQQKKEKKEKKQSTKEKKQQLEDSLRPICFEMVSKEHDDFGGGFHKPTWRDLLAVKLCHLPLAILRGITWTAKYFTRRLFKKELNDEERNVLTRRAVGEVTWASISDEEKERALTLDLWNSENLEQFRDHQKLKKLNLSAGQQKKYNRWKKGGKKSHDD